MSYGISIVNPKSGETMMTSEPHTFVGGTYSPNSKELWMNITFNYYPFFNRENVFGDGGIKNLNGLQVSDAIPLVHKAVHNLREEDLNADGSLYDGDADDYWAPTERNARKSLEVLLGLLILSPAGGVVDISY